MSGSCCSARDNFLFVYSQLMLHYFQTFTTINHKVDLWETCRYVTCKSYKVLFDTSIRLHVRYSLNLSGVVEVHKLHLIDTTYLE